MNDYVESEVTVSSDSLGKLFKVRFGCRNVMINLDLDDSSRFDASWSAL